jgi:hypothetical protein
MPVRTSLFRMNPWVGGVNTSLDPTQIASNELVEANNVQFGERGSRGIREGINQDWDDQSNSSESIIGLYDFWFGTSSGKTQKIVGVTDGKKIYSYSTAGARSANLFAGTAWSSAVTKVSMTAINNLLIIAADGSGNVVKKWSGSGNAADLGGTPPAASIAIVHQGRLWLNDKTNVDRWHYSPTSDPETWGGTGDSGAIDIGVGDGDPEGFTGAFSFKGTLFVAKRTKLYRIDGDAPENYSPRLVSSGIGIVSHNSIAYIDQDDVFFVSDRGVHAISATASFGDFEGAFLSKDIQRTFNEDFTKSRLQYAWSAYDPTINSYLLAVTDEEFTASSNKAVWAYNIQQKVWYRLYSNLSCQSLIVAHDSSKRRAYIGSNVTRVFQAKNGLKYDQNTSGTSTGIPLKIKTGVIFPGDDAFSMKAWKRFTLFYRPEGSHNITVTIKIDNYPNQTLTFSQSTGADLLGTTFILGSSALASSPVAAPYTLPISGYGRGIQITIEQTGVLTEANVEIQGFAIEYEAVELRQEVTNAQSA